MKHIILPIYAIFLTICCTIIYIICIILILYSIIWNFKINKEDFSLEYDFYYSKYSILWSPYHKPPIINRRYVFDTFYHYIWNIKNKRNLNYK